MSGVLFRRPAMVRPTVCVVGLLIAFVASPLVCFAEEALDPTDSLSLDWLPLAQTAPESVADAEATTEAEMKSYAEVIKGLDDPFDMIAIPGGKVLLGSPEDEDDRTDDEGPQVEVEIEPFWMGKHEVTWDEYETWSLRLDSQRRDMYRTQNATEKTPWDDLVDAVARPTNAYSDMTFGMGRDGYPAICMTQYAAKMYCKWLTACTGHYYRLPTEAEWEYACRAGTTTAYSFGDDPDDLDDHGVYFDNCDDKYAKIGTKEPNPWGLHDMHGNVSEWVLDEFDPENYAALAGKSVKSPFNVPTEEYSRCVRGGSWDDDPDRCRSAARRASSEDWKMQDPQIPQSIWYLTDAYFVGFRVVRPLRTPTEEEALLYEPDPQVMHEYSEAHGGKM